MTLLEQQVKIKCVYLVLMPVKYVTFIVNELSQGIILPEIRY